MRNVERGSFWINSALNVRDRTHSKCPARMLFMYKIHPSAFNVPATYDFPCRQQSLRSDERGPEPTLEQSQSDVPPGDLSHQGTDGILRQGASKAAPRFRRLSRPLAEEERVSVRLFKVGFLERRWQGETGPAGAVFGKEIHGIGYGQYFQVLRSRADQSSYLCRPDSVEVYHFQRLFAARAIIASRQLRFISLRLEIH